MNITFILGNGFDIQMGLQSKYSQFLDEYTKPQKGDNHNLSSFKLYLQKVENKTLWSNAEKAFGMHLGKFSDDTLGDYSERIRDFEEKMIAYLEMQQNRCKYEQKEKIKEKFCDFVFNFPQDILANGANEVKTATRGNDTRFFFITFNYTNVIDNIIKCCTADEAVRKHPGNPFSTTDYFIKPVHVHGTLDTSIIMGVNDESQLDLSGGTTLLPSLKYQLIKPEMNRGIRNNWDKEARNIINSSDVIAIYGVSYGETDNIWWRTICEWLAFNSNHKLVAFMRDKSTAYNKRLAWQELQCQELKRKEISEKLGLNKLQNYTDELLEQIYIVVNTSRLEMKDLIICY